MNEKKSKSGAAKIRARHRLLGKLLLQGNFWPPHDPLADIATRILRSRELAEELVNRILNPFVKDP
jgi:hypothetical protein